MPRGGKRSGTPGQQYSNRSDMQAGPRTARGGREPVYGEGTKREAVRASAPAASAAGQRVPAGVQPGQIGSLTAPSERPNEPVTAGLSLGEGPGPEALHQVPDPDEALFDLRALQAAFPQYKNLARLIALAEERA